MGKRKEKVGVGIHTVVVAGKGEGGVGKPPTELKIDRGLLRGCCCCFWPALGDELTNLLRELCLFFLPEHKVYVQQKQARLWVLTTSDTVTYSSPEDLRRVEVLVYF